MARKRKKKEFAGRNLVRALNHPLRVEILDALAEGEASPATLSDKLDATLQTVAYHTRILFKCGCLERTRTEQKRGAIEHFYRAVPESYIGHRLWRQVPRTLRGSTIVISLESFVDKLLAALKAGAVDRDETSLGAVTLALDDAGHEAAVGIVQDALSQLKAVDRQSRERATKGGSPLVPVMGAVALFQVAKSFRGEES